MIKLKLIYSFRRLIHFFPFLFVLIFSGCATYHPKPLDEMIIKKTIENPDFIQIEIEASRIKHPLLKPVRFNLGDGLSPDEAAILAVLNNPFLRTLRDQKFIAIAQLLQARLLPNPQLSYSLETPVGGNIKGTINAYGLGTDWEIGSLIAHTAKISAARAHVNSVDLSIAWQEWQVAEAAKLQTIRLSCLEKQLLFAKEVKKVLSKSLEATRQAVAKGEKTALDLAAAKSAWQDAYLTILALQQEKRSQRLEFNRLLGLSSEKITPIQQDVSLPCLQNTTDKFDLMNGLESRRLDLLSLKIGYQSQEAKVRAAVLSQFPRIGIGFINNRDTGNVITRGFGITVDLPIFNHNQGEIAIEMASRRKLFDQYISRLFEAQAEVAHILNEIKSLKEQINATKASIKTQKNLVSVYTKALQESSINIIAYYNEKSKLVRKQLSLLKLNQRLAEMVIGLEIVSGKYFSTNS